jgi:hypothetical protein
MLIVLSHPFLRQRHAVQVVTPTCSNHRERLTTAAACDGVQLAVRFRFHTPQPAAPPADVGVSQTRFAFWRMHVLSAVRVIAKLVRKGGSAYFKR